MRNKQFYVIGSAIISLVCFSMLSCSNEIDTDDSSRVKIALRESGNQLLLRQQDSTSIILPVIQKDKATYQLSFQEELSFEPNELVTVIDSSFMVSSLPQDYRVEVIQCSNQEVAYSYEMNVEEKRTIIPCAGRYLTKGCYLIEVKFINQSTSVVSSHLLIYVGLLGILVFLVYYFKVKRTTIKTSKNGTTTYSEIGSYHFYPEQNKLIKAAIEISLSKKECELLELFVASPNQVIKRDELTKKVWEDHGVIVGRSLDTYISKLRKKLQDDDSIKLTNVHGVGYKLEVN